MKAGEYRRPAIMILHFGALGDLLLSLEALRGLRRRFPTHELLLVAQEGLGKLLQESGEIDAWLSRERLGVGELVGGLEIADRTFRDAMARCSHAVCWMADTQETVAKNFRRHGLSRCLVTSFHSSELRGVHAGERYLETLAPWGVAPAAAARPLTLVMSGPVREKIEARMDWCIGSDAPILAVHPGSGSVHKCCPPDRLATAVRDLRAQWNGRVVVCRGPADRQSVARFVTEMGAIPHEIVEPESLAEMAHLLTYASLFIGHDSGLTHLAAALGVPTVAIFGPTRSEQWAPIGRHVSVVRGGVCECRGWEEIRRCHKKPCLRIAPGHVVKSADALLLDQSRGGGGVRLPSRKHVC